MQFWGGKVLLSHGILIDDNVIVALFYQVEEIKRMDFAREYKKSRE